MDILRHFKWILAAPLLMACVPANAHSRLVDQGGEAFNNGNYVLAVEKWTKAAKRGDPFGFLNMGMLFENGIGNQPKDLNLAGQWYLGGAQRGHFASMVALARVQIALGYPDFGVSWLNYAARWNDGEAIAALRALKVPVPAADLRMTHNQNQQIAQAQMGYALGCIIAGGCFTAVAQPRTASFRPSHSLTSQWFSRSADRMCRFENGSIINVGTAFCPPALEGR